VLLLLLLLQNGAGEQALVEFRGHQEGRGGGGGGTGGGRPKGAHVATPLQLILQQVHVRMAVFANEFVHDNQAQWSPNVGNAFYSRSTISLSKGGESPLTAIYLTEAQFV